MWDDYFAGFEAVLVHDVLFGGEVEPYGCIFGEGRV